MRNSMTRWLILTLLLAAGVPATGSAQDPHASHGTPEPAASPAAVASPAPVDEGTAVRGTPGRAAVRTLAAVRTTASISVDGRIDEAAWQAVVPAIDFIQRGPNPGQAATERTEVRVLYDDQAIYVAARMYDSEPQSIVGQLARRDQWVFGDWFHLGIDSYHDRRTAFVFGVNPRGVKRDFAVYNDDQEDGSWDAVWEVATRVDDGGWTAEFRIPLSQLRFSGTDGTGVGAAGARTWGINFSRDIGRRGEESFWAPALPDEAGMVSLFGVLHGIEGLRPPRRLEVLPYAVTRVTRAPGTPGDPFHSPTDHLGSAGADIKMGVTSNLTLTATINPDFGQVEADPAQVNLTAYETFFEERRPFFVEGADLFRIDGPQLFYSRRIGRRPQAGLPSAASFGDMPEASTILSAVKLSGRTSSGWSLGFLDAVTAPEAADWVDAGGARDRSPVEPLTHYAVGRLGRDFRGGETGFAALVTATNRKLDDDRFDFLRSSAYTGGVTARHRFANRTYEATAGLLGSRIAGDTAAIGRVQRGAGHYFQRPGADHLTYDPTRTSLAGYRAAAGVNKIAGDWRWSLSGSVTSPTFEINDIGFNSENDHAEQRLSIGYNRFRPGTLFRRWSVSTNQRIEATTGGELLERTLQLNANAQLLNQWGGNFMIMRHAQAWATDALRGGVALAKPGHYMGSGGVYSDQRRALQGQMNVFWDVEDDGEGHTLNLSPSLTLRSGSRTEISLRPNVSLFARDWQYVGRRTVAGEPVYLLARLEQTTTSLTTRLSYTVSPTLSLQFYAQPFISAGDYAGYKEVADPRARPSADRFSVYGSDRIQEQTTPQGKRQYAIDRNRDGSTDIVLDDPDFNTKQFRSNTVLRWEYRPGSALFLVWSQGRSDRIADGAFDLGRDSRQLLDAPATNVLMLKLNYWVGL